MSIASEINRIKTNIANAYTSIGAKGGTLPENENSENLAAAINSITINNNTTGDNTSPEFSLQDKSVTISQNGNIRVVADSEYDGLDSVNIVTSVPEGSDAKYGATINNIFGDVNYQGELQAPSDLNLVFDNVKSIYGTSILSYIFYKKPWVKSVTFPDLTTLQGSESLFHTFDGCTGLTSVNFPSLITVGNTSSTNQMSYAFANCSNLTEVDLSSVEKINRGMNYAFTKTGLTSVDLSSFTGFNFGGGGNALSHTFDQCLQLQSVDVSGLTSLPSSASSCFDNTFYGCSNLTSVNFSSLESIAAGNALQQTFYGCSSLVSMSFPSLTSITGSNSLSGAFANCVNLENLFFPELTTITGANAMANMLNGCSKITSISFPKLSEISGSTIFRYTFRNCNAIADIYFPSLTSSSFGSQTSQFSQMLYDVRNANCTVHFPSNLQTVIGNWTDVISGFGANNTSTITVLFDLAATE